jgi:hypothetical protein
MELQGWLEWQRRVWESHVDRLNALAETVGKKPMMTLTLTLTRHIKASPRPSGAVGRTLNCWQVVPADPCSVHHP